jgi:integrase
MSVRQREWVDKQGKTRKAWIVDVVFEFPNGSTKRVQKTSPVNTARGAEDFERQLRNELLAGTYKTEEVEKPKLTFAEFEAKYLQFSSNNNKASTTERKRRVFADFLVPHFGEMPLEEITFERIESFKATAVSGSSISTVNLYLQYLKSALRLAVKYGFLVRTPDVLKLKDPTAHDTIRQEMFLTFEEAERYLGSIKERFWHTLVLTGLRTGLRRGELIGLRWEDVDLVAKKVTVRNNVWMGQEGTPKGNRSREVPLTDAAVAALKAHRHLNRHVFCKEDGSMLSPEVIDNNVRRYARKAGLSKTVSPKTLRHTFASHLVMHGVPLKAVQELLGHAHIVTTMVYAHLSPGFSRDAVALLDQPHNATLTQHAESSGTKQRVSGDL